MNDLQIGQMKIRRDEEGRYCLNDLHRTSGGEKRHSPNRWLRYNQAQALIKILNQENNAYFGVNNLPESNIPDAYLGVRKTDSEPVYGLRTVVTISKGRPETFVVKDLIYAYAMWVSPEFHLVVIRAFDSLVNGEFIQPFIQSENYWFSRRPFWPAIRERVLSGEPYRNIAEALMISRGRVSRSVRSMIRVGLLNPDKVCQVQKGPAKKAALRHGSGWGTRQLSLFNLPLIPEVLPPDTGSEVLV